jgi:hypothetical protein
MPHDPNCECPTCDPLPAGSHFKTLGDAEWHTVGQGPDAESAAPNPYAAGLAKLRAASATDQWRFEEHWKAERLATLQAEYEAIDEHLQANPTPRLTTAELAPYGAPDPYRAGLEKMRSEKTVKQ